MTFAALVIFAGCSKPENQARKPSKNIDSSAWIENLIDGKAAAEKEEPICYFYESSVFNNLDYEEKKVKRSEDRPDNFWQKLFHKTTHHEWEEKDWEHLKHYHVLADNIMNELWIYLLKAGWKVEYYRDSEYRKYFKIYF